jgi:hypothetical protein
MLDLMTTIGEINALSHARYLRREARRKAAKEAALAEALAAGLPPPVEPFKFQPVAEADEQWLTIDAAAKALDIAHGRLKMWATRESLDVRTWPAEITRKDGASYTMPLQHVELNQCRQLLAHKNASIAAGNTKATESAPIGPDGWGGAVAVGEAIGINPRTVNWWGAQGKVKRRPDALRCDFWLYRLDECKAHADLRASKKGGRKAKDWKRELVEGWSKGSDRTQAQNAAGFGITAEGKRRVEAARAAEVNRRKP